MDLVFPQIITTGFCGSYSEDIDIFFLILSEYSKKAKEAMQYQEMLEIFKLEWFPTGYGITMDLKFDLSLILPFKNGAPTHF